MGIIFPLFGFELLAPPIALVFLTYELHCSLRIPIKNSEAGSIQKSIPLQLGIILALIVLQVVILLPIGFQWNSLVLAFTESKGFVFSSGSTLNF
jgi:hypothetical protein